MPTYRITAPDGRTFDVTGDGSAQDALAHVQQQYGHQAPAPEAAPDPSAGGGTLSIGPLDTGIKTPQGVDRFLSGAGKAMVDVGRGVGQMVGLVDKEDVAESRALDAPLMNTGAGKVGNIAGGVATAVPTLAIPGANTVAGAGLVGAAFGAAQPTVEGESRLKNAAVGGATGAAAQYLGGKVSQWAGKKLSERAAAASTKEAQNAVRDATLKEARQAGYVVPPSTTNPTITNRVAESVAGKAQTQQIASVKNQQVTNRLARRALGLGDDAPLTKETLNAVRSKAGGVYRAIEAAGEIATDDSYVDDLARIASSVDEVAKDFPDLNLNNNEEVTKLVDGLLREKFSSKGAIEATKQLRKAASGNLSGINAADPAKRALGYAQRDAAAAIEDQMIRHLEASGKGGLAKAFDDSRKLIAKTYSVESALNEGSGNVVARLLGGQLKKGKPLSGELETIAKFAQAFGKSAQEITDSPGVSAVDAIVGGVGGSTVNPALFALPVGRNVARSAITSRGLNQAMGTPKYAPGKAGSALLKTAKASKAATLPAVVYATQQ